MHSGEPFTNIKSNYVSCKRIVYHKVVKILSRAPFAYLPLVPLSMHKRLPLDSNCYNLFHLCIRMQLEYLYSLVGVEGENFEVHSSHKGKCW